jgi:asparagine synthase (glutamine-hydrolysing)
MSRSALGQTTAKPVQTFSIGFDDGTYNELPYARMVANTFGADHHEEVLRPGITTFVDLVDQLAAFLDEPFADFSIFPTYLVSRLARKQVKVVLSGDGGDELFAGYDTYGAQQIERWYRRLPAPLRYKAIPALLNQVSPRPAKKGVVNKTKRFVEGAILPAGLQHTRWMMFLNGDEKARLYRPELQAALNGQTAAALLEDTFRRASHFDWLAQQQYVDLKTYLADDILAKVDRMSMAASLEARVPLLDHRIVEFALSLPPHMKLGSPVLHRGQTKIILRQAMAGRLPAAILNKPKQGFSIPLKHWLRGPLRPMMTDLLAADCIRRRGYFENHTVQQWMDEHLDGRANHSHRLWALMVFELWHQHMVTG